MPSGSSIVSSHSDEALNAEIAFWAASADVDFASVPRTELTAACTTHAPTAVLFELKDQDEEGIDVLTRLCNAAKCKIVALTTLDAKTISSIRRLFDSKSLDIVVMSRADFSTRLLSDLLKLRQAGTTLDRETLAAAIRDGYVIAHYQPKVPFQPGSTNYGVEALCRIEHPTLGLLYPDTFIPLAEAHGLIGDLTDAVTVHAFRSQAEWDKQGLKLRLAINISPNLMADTVWYDRFQLRCQEHAVDPTRITLEVTESSSQGGKVMALEILSRLRLKGFLLSIDDFGTGFSSLETLYKLPFGELKIDKGFVFDLQKSSEARTLIESTIALAKKLGLKITAEGVENEEIFRELRDLNCDDAQGYFISKALPADLVVPFLSEWRAKTVSAAPVSKFASIHALLGELLSPADDDDCTMVLSAAPAGTGRSSLDVAAEIPALVMGGNLLKALECTHRGLAACDAGSAQLLPTLKQLRRELENALLGASRAELVLERGQIKLLGGDSFLVGRQTSTAGTDIAIPCRWLSRGEKSLRLFHREGSWCVEDLGSTNGHFIGGRRIGAQETVALPAGLTRLEVGRAADGHAPAWLDLEIQGDGSVRVSFGMTGGLPEADDITWVAFPLEATMGEAQTAGLRLSGCGSNFAADIRLQDGSLWVAPRPGRTISLDGIAFCEAVPLVPGTTLGIGDKTWPVQALSAIVADQTPAAVSA
jgi:EAL domain-containing protein (putative c-di-GMP-specific phosphodiesterase class I)